MAKFSQKGTHDKFCQLLKTCATLVLFLGEDDCLPYLNLKVLNEKS